MLLRDPYSPDRSITCLSFMVSAADARPLATVATEALDALGTRTAGRKGGTWASERERNHKYKWEDARL